VTVVLGKVKARVCLYDFGEILKNLTA